MKTNGKNKTKQCRDHITNLMRRRSVIALCAGLLTLILSFYGMIAGISNTVTVLGRNAFVSFIYFTMLSNMLAALSAAFTIPFAVEGIRKKRFILPGWIAVMHYCATVSITIMLLFVICFISWKSPHDAFGDFNLVLHIFCPITILTSFFQVENGYMYTAKDQLLGTAPFIIYMIVYYIETFLIGAGSGGWQDIYHIKEYPPYWINAILLLLFGFGISFMIRMLSNRLTSMRKNKMFSFWKDDTDPVELRIEAYGLGIMTGSGGDKNSIRIPYDIMEYLAQKYRLDTDDLIKPFVMGVLIGLRERK